MKLYYTKGACSLVVRITINEIGLDCEYESVNLTTKKTETGEDYWKINPKGAVPALMTDDNELLTENTVINQYLADKYNALELLPPIGNFKRYRILEWLTYITTELHKGFGPLFNPAFPDEIKQNIVIPLLEKKFAFINQHLEGRDYLLGDTFTLPDGYLCVMLLWLNHFKIDINQWPQLARYYTKLKTRKAIQMAFKQEGII